MSLTKATYTMITGSPVNVLDFGAIGDGVADDGAAIRAAIASITPNGGQVYLPAGTYKVTAAVGDASNTAIFVPSNVRVCGASQVGTKIVPGANNTVCFRVIGLNGGIENLQIDNVATTYINVSGIRLGPTDEAQTTTRSDVEFNNITNISIRRVAEGITLKCGPTVGGADSYCFYNTFTNIDIRNTTLGIWLKEPTTQPGSGNNRNTFISCRVGETGTNTGLKIDAGDTCKFIACSFEGIQSGTSPNATPTAVQIAYNSATFAATHNQFYGLIIEACTRGIDNDNDLTEFYGWFSTAPYYSPSNRPLAVDISTDGLKLINFIKSSYALLNQLGTPAVLFNPGDFSTRKATITCTSGTSGSYNGTILKNNTDLAGAQANTSLPSWAVDIGGAEAGNGIGVSDTLGILHKTAGGASWVTRFLGDSAGAWKPGADASQSLGTASLRWSEVFAAAPAINTSDEREKTFLSIEDAERAAALEIKNNLRKFKFNAAIEKKGNGARIHFGVAAQQIGQIMEKHGLDPNQYSFFCYDKWDKQVDDNNKIILNAGDRYGVRYEELLCFIIAAM